MTIYTIKKTVIDEIPRWYKGKNTIDDAVERTINETQREIERQKDSGNFNPTTIINMTEHRRLLESHCDEVNPFREIATAVISPLSYIFMPVILLGAAAYLEGRSIYERIKAKKRT